MRKFLFNGAVISALFSGIAAVRATRSGPRDWRLALLWVSWAASTAIAIGNVRDNAEHAD
ncbi:hypothetical protein [Frondihabitans australicus]|uniref:Uncharacterized protein n=1 Tax=Frondihabitans australicus TaxID=386892 RepID=A0A495IC83_9MICO|nr:hypothetical protein [Frondihabitans australicus]RKR73613.1 hypothetical protein C8E83_0706 [Frondihabitans australicus]